MSNRKTIVISEVPSAIIMFTLAYLCAVGLMQTVCQIKVIGLLMEQNRQQLEQLNTEYSTI